MLQVLRAVQRVCLQGGFALIAPMRAAVPAVRLRWHRLDERGRNAPPGQSCSLPLPALCQSSASRATMEAAMGGHGAHNHSALSAAPDAHTAMMGLRCDGSFLPKGGGTWMGKQRAFKRCGARLVPVPGLWWCWATCKLIWPGERTRTCAGARSGKGCREPPVSSPLSCCKARSSLGRWAARRHPARAPPAAAAGGTGSFGPALFFTSAALVPDPAACPPPSVQATSTQVIRRH